MDIVFSKEIDRILGMNGIFLKDIGINNWAISKDDALAALNQLLEISIPILGGDVCYVSNRKIELNYDSWFYEREIDEPFSEYIYNSNLKAKEYIENYPKGDLSVFFILVCDTLLK